MPDCIRRVIVLCLLARHPMPVLYVRYCGAVSAATITGPCPETIPIQGNSNPNFFTSSILYVPHLPVYFAVTYCTPCFNARPFMSVGSALCGRKSRMKKYGLRFLYAPCCLSQAMIACCLSIPCFSRGLEAVEEAGIGTKEFPKCFKIHNQKN